MPISITCVCGRQLLAKDEYAGRRTQCPECGRELMIPGPGSSPPPDLADPYDLAVGSEKPADGPISFLPRPAAIEPGVVPRTSGKAIASLVLGLLSFIFCCFTGVPGLILGVLGLNEINASKGRIQGQGIAIAGIIFGALTLLGIPVSALLLPAVQQAREAARRIQCSNNLKEMGLAMHNFHSANGAFPAQAITDADGKPLLSWRVAILPYLGRQDLYQQFHLDEPWDSANNRALLTQMPQVYACPSNPIQEEVAQGLTHYQAIAGPGAPFDPSIEKYREPGVTLGVPLSMVTDGTSNTIMAAEGATAVEWTRPDDLAYQPNAQLPVLDSKHLGGENVLFMDGSVRFIKKSIAEAVLRALFTRAGNEIVSADSY